MVSSIEKAILREIKKAAVWYEEKYKRKFEIHQRYDRVEKHFSFRIVAHIGGADRVLAFGVSAKTAESPEFFTIKGRITPYIRQCLTKAHATWEPQHNLKLQGLE